MAVAPSRIEMGGVPAAISRRFSGLQALLDNKYYLDSFNEKVFAGGARLVGTGRWTTGDFNYDDNVNFVDLEDVAPSEITTGPETLAFEVTFPEAGEYEYICTFHARMMRGVLAMFLLGWVMASAQAQSADSAAVELAASTAVVSEHASAKPANCSGVVT